MDKKDTHNPNTVSRPLNPEKEGSAEKRGFSGRLIDNLVYQIRTLSNAIIGFSNLLAAEDLTDTQREYAAEIHRAGKGLSSIVNDVVDLVRLEAGNLKPDFAECDLAELLEEVEGDLSRPAVSKGLSFSIAVEECVPALLSTDRARLKRCLLNLGGNAVQYTQNGRIELRLRMDLSGAQPRIRFDITDTGAGISPERLSHLFEPFQKREQINTGMLASIHLGVQGYGSLPLTRQFVHLLGGQIEVVSKEGVGSTFSILLPAEPVSDKSKMLSFPPRFTRADWESETPGSKQCIGHILLVEDEESNRTVLSLILENLGLEVTAAANGQSAMEAAGRSGFDAVLMDIQLPDISGLEVARQLRAKGFQTPIIALSAEVLEESRNQQIEELFDAFLAKPVDGPQLAEVLESFLPTIQMRTAEVRD
jgi:CheY-like chemotaxis protein/nitrogen-specific signal transduction histidine kinase